MLLSFYGLCKKPLRSEMVIYWDFLGRVIEIFFLGIGTFVMLNWMDGSREEVFNFTSTVCHLIAIFLLNQ